MLVLHKLQTIFGDTMRVDVAENMNKNIYPYIRTKVPKQMLAFV